MSDRVYASIFYIVVIVGGAWTAVTLGEFLAREALTNLALVPGVNSGPSRVDTFLAAQERGATSENAKERLIPAATSLPAGTLAKAMDEAEQIGDNPAAKESDTAATTPTVPAPLAEKPRVAGWVKRIPKRALSAVLPDETSGRLIMRSLRAEM